MSQVSQSNESSLLVFQQIYLVGKESHLNVESSDNSRDIKKDYKFDRQYIL